MCLGFIWLCMVACVVLGSVLIGVTGNDEGGVLIAGFTFRGIFVSSDADEEKK